MRKNQKEKKALAIVLSVMILVFVAGVCGIYLYSQTGESQDQPQVAVKKRSGFRNRCDAGCRCLLL